jgi:hypothetical protein
MDFDTMVREVRGWLTALPQGRFSGCYRHGSGNKPQRCENCIERQLEAKLRNLGLTVKSQEVVANPPRGTSQLDLLVTTADGEALIEIKLGGDHPDGSGANWQLYQWDQLKRREDGKTRRKVALFGERLLDPLMRKWLIENHVTVIEP